MRKPSDSKVKVICTENIEDIPLPKQCVFPFQMSIFTLLKKENPLKQEYYYLQRGEDYAFFVMYYNYMNIFTLGNLKCNYPVKVIGFPCSLSNEGYVTNNEVMMLDYLNTIKGGKLILNVSRPLKRKDYVIGETLPTCILSLKVPGQERYFETTQEYLFALRSSYRRRIQLARRACADMEIRENPEEPEIHKLY